MLQSLCHVCLKELHFILKTDVQAQTWLTKDESVKVLFRSLSTTPVSFCGLVYQFLWRAFPNCRCCSVVVVHNSRCLHYLCNYSGIFGVLQHIHFSSWPSVTFNKKVQDDNNYFNNLLSVVCGTSCMDHVIEMGCATEICLERSISSSVCFSENRSCFILLFLQKDCSTIRRPKILQGLSVAARRIFKDSLTY